jgi:hypothetical protein
MRNLYEILGVRRDATADQLRKAYYRVAKAAHPDTGGSVEEFAIVKTAYDCLNDPDKRRRYDATGTIEGNEPDQTAARAMNIIVGVLGQVMAETESRGREIETVDVVQSVLIVLNRSKTQMQDQVKKLRKSAADLRKTAQRFHAKSPDKPNRITPMIEAQAAQQYETAVQNEREIEVFTHAIALMEDHEFDWVKDAPPETETLLQRVAREMNQSTGRAGVWR